MGRQEGGFAREQGVIGLRGLVLEDIQAGSADLPCLEGRRQGDFVDDAAPGGVDDDRVFLHEGKALGVDEVAGALG